MPRGFWGKDPDKRIFGGRKMPRVNQSFDEAGNYERSLSDSLCDYEREIMGLWDAGRSREWIVEHTGRTMRCVRHTISLYDVCEDPREKQNMVQASADLAARIRQFLPVVPLSSDDEKAVTAR